MFTIVQDTDEFASKLRDARQTAGSAIVETGTVPGSNHFTIVGSIGQQSDETSATVIDFIRRVTTRSV
jgi:hypothetical protein